jgi:hypothetical protein
LGGGAAARPLRHEGCAGHGVSPRALLRPDARIWHVTDAASLPLILRHGLLSAERLVALFGADPALLGRNRDRYVTLSHPMHGTATLRRQWLRDAVLAPRLAPGVTPEAYRRFINSQVYFWPERARAEALDRFEPSRSQVVLSLPVAALGVPLLASPINAGGVFDRQPPATARRRHPGLYQTLESMTEPVAELAIPGGLPPGLPWAIHSAARSTSSTASP